MTPNASLLGAIAWMIGALTSFAAMSVSIRALTGEMHAFQMLFIRSAIGVLILLPIITGRWCGNKSAREGWPQLRRRYLPDHLLRNVLHLTGPILWIFGIALLPPAPAPAIPFPSPLC